MNALLKVSEQTWREVQDALADAGRRESLLGDEMNMDGITLVVGASPPATGVAPERLVVSSVTGDMYTESVSSAPSPEVAFHWVATDSVRCS
jgi:hypothetical protein